MNEQHMLKKHILDGWSGIEVAPYFNPVFPKVKNDKILIMDIFDTETLKRNAKADPNIEERRIAEIEEVDIVSNATEIGEAVTRAGLAGKIDFIVSSHNFEHLPNPIKFLRGCETALVPGGVLAMAIPDSRACFDHFRFPTRLADWLESWFEDRLTPSNAQIFDQRSNTALYYRDGLGEPQLVCDMNRRPPEHFIQTHEVRSAFEHWNTRRLNNSNEYIDTHCSVLFPELMEMLINDLKYLNLIKFDIIEISQTQRYEFFVHLRNAAQPQSMSESEYYARRDASLRKINRIIGSAGFGPRNRLLRRLNRLLAKFRTR